MSKPLSILIVDDEEELATLFAELVRTIGLDGISFTNPLLAFEYFRDNPQKFSLVITDLRMPGMCGLDLSNKIRELNDSVKIFLITAFDTFDIESNQIYRQAKIDKILQKPIKLAVLRNLIKKTLNY
jgi:DNA-binding NtrC family response regulator